MRFLIILIIFSCFLNYANLKINKKKWFMPKTTEGCHLNICNKTLNYPERRIKKLLNKKITFKGYFGTVVEPLGPREHPVLRSLGKDENLCETKIKTILPKIAYDDDFNPRFIVNVKGHFQLVTFEICAAKTCLFNKLPLGFTTRCHQRYHKVPLLHVTDKGNLEYGGFSVPSTCVCTYSKSTKFSKKS